MCPIAEVTELLNDGGRKSVHSDTLPDDFIDRVNASAGNRLLDQALGFEAELDGHGEGLRLS